MFEVIVTNKQPLTASVCRLQLAAVDGSALPAWQAGAHIDVHLPNGIIRQYSLCGGVDTKHYETYGTINALTLDPTPPILTFSTKPTTTNPFLPNFLIVVV